MDDDIVIKANGVSKKSSRNPMGIKFCDIEVSDNRLLEIKL